MELDSATNTLLEKLRLEQRKAILAQQQETSNSIGAGGASFEQSLAQYQAQQQQQQQRQQQGGGRNWAGMSPQQQHEEVVKERAKQNNNRPKIDAGSAIAATKMEAHLRMEIEALQDRVRSLENSLQYERERHAQTRELLRIALKPPPEEAEHIARQSSPRRGVPIDGPSPSRIAEAMFAGNSPAMMTNTGVGVLGGSPSGDMASYHRYEIYGPQTPSRVAQQIYDRAHQLEHPQSASKQILQHAQQQQALAQYQQQAAGHSHLHTDGSALLAAHQFHHQNMNEGGGHSAAAGGSSSARRNASSGHNSRSGTPSRVSAARPFGVGERRFAPLAVIGPTVTYAVGEFDAVSNISSSATFKRRTMTSTPQRRQSPAATLRSPAQMYGAWA